jgi:hypothetical protein
LVDCHGLEKVESESRALSSLNFPKDNRGIDKATHG